MKKKEKQYEHYQRKMYGKLLQDHKLKLERLILHLKMLLMKKATIKTMELLKHLIYVMKFWNTMMKKNMLVVV